MLESIRQSNAAELNRPSRRDADVRELLAAKIIAELKFQAAEKRMRALSANKDFVKVKVGDSVWSRRELEQRELREAGKNNFWTQVKLKTGELLFRSNKKGATADKLDYPALHKALTGALETLENARLDELAKLKEFNRTLSEIFAAETNPNKTKLAPAFSAYELAEAEDLSVDAGRDNFYDNALSLQEGWLREKLAESSQQASDSKVKPNAGKIGNQKPVSKTAETSIQFQSEPEAQAAAEKVIGKYVLGRAAARSVIAQTKAIEAQENLDRYGREKFFAKHRIKDVKTGVELEISLRDVEPRKHYYLLDSILERALESKERKNLRESVRQAALSREKELSQNLNDAQSRVERLENQKSRTLEQYSAVQAEVRPIFTPKEIAALDVRAARTIEKSEANRLEKIVSDAEKDSRVERIQDLLASAAKSIQLLAPDLARVNELKIGEENGSARERQTKNQSQEVTNRFADSTTSLRANHKSAEHTQEKITVREKGRTR